MNITDLPILSADDIMSSTPYAAAVDALDEALRRGLDPASDPPRTAIVADAGQLLLMPSVDSKYAGIKLATVAPANAAVGLPTIQAVYVLFDATTLSPVALLDGTALTTLRTPAVSAVAARHLAPERIEHLVVFGSGPQGRGHVDALAAVKDIGRVTIIGRDQAKAATLVARIADDGIAAAVGSPADVPDADMIVCATTSPTPLFDGADVRDDACVLAIGAHEPDCREVDAQLMGRSTVVVEDRGAAMREAGDVVQAIGDGALDIDDVIPLGDLVAGRSAPAAGRPAVFKGTGMSWQDLVVASAAYRARA